jgi:hypothetical protein
MNHYALPRTELPTEQVSYWYPVSRRGKPDTLECFTGTVAEARAGGPDRPPWRGRLARDCEACYEGLRNIPANSVCIHEHEQRVLTHKDIYAMVTNTRLAGRRAPMVSTKVSVDVQLVRLIKVLWAKEYETYNSCSGEAYISLSGDLRRVLSLLPEGSRRDATPIPNQYYGAEMATYRFSNAALLRWNQTTQLRARSKVHS